MLAWIIAIILTVGSVAGIFHTANPIVFINTIHWIINFSVERVSGPMTINILSWLLFGKILANEISSHGNFPPVCAASCK